MDAWMPNPSAATSAWMPTPEGQSCTRERRFTPENGAPVARLGRLPPSLNRLYSQSATCSRLGGSLMGPFFAINLPIERSHKCARNASTSLRSWMSECFDRALRGFLVHVVQRDLASLELFDVSGFERGKHVIQIATQSDDGVQHRCQLRGLFGQADEFFDFHGLLRQAPAKCRWVWGERIDHGWVPRATAAASDATGSTRTAPSRTWIAARLAPASFTCSSPSVTAFSTDRMTSRTR